MKFSECTCVLSPSRYNRVLVPYVCLPLVSCVVVFFPPRMICCDCVSACACVSFFNQLSEMSASLMRDSSSSTLSTLTPSSTCPSLVEGHFDIRYIAHIKPLYDRLSSLKPLFDAFVAYRLTEPTSGASTPDLDPFSPVDKKRALKGYTFVPDIQEIRVRSEKTQYRSLSLSAS